MPTIEELTKKYKEYSDEELIEIHEKVDEYSNEAKIAIENVIVSIGGIDKLKERINKQNEIQTEIQKIEEQTTSLYYQNKSKENILSEISYDLISENQFYEIIEETINKLEKDKEDKKIKPKTIIGGIIGGFLGGTIGGIIWGLQMIHSGHIFFILGFGLVILSYALIRLFTRQSKKNIVVIIMTIISVVYALILGQILYEIFG